MTEITKSKKGTRITAIVILSVVFAISLFVLIASLATVSLNPRFVAKPDEIYVYEAKKTTPSGQITKEDDLYKEFLEYYDSMFSSSFLSALFSGRLGGYELSTNQLSTTSKICEE